VRAQSAAPSTRVFALMTGSLGLLAVGILILTVTPRGQQSPIAISATTTPATFATTVSTVARPATLAPAFASRGVSTTAPGAPARALATPIGEEGLAIITHDAMPDEDATVVDVQLASGMTTVGRVIERVGETTVILLPDEVTDSDENEPGHRIAPEMPNESEIVVVMASPPITIAFADVETLDVGEGTAVLDRAGRLVGICTHRNRVDGVRVIEVSDVPDGATSVVP
jgi:hypothetical protein